MVCVCVILHPFLASASEDIHPAFWLVIGTYNLQ